MCVCLCFFVPKSAFHRIVKSIFTDEQKKIFFFINIDEEDVFMVFDLFTGGDLRYHLLQQVNLNNLFFATLTLSLPFVHIDAKVCIFIVSLTRWRY